MNTNMSTDVKITASASAFRAVRVAAIQGAAACLLPELVSLVGDYEPVPFEFRSDAHARLTVSARRVESCVPAPYAYRHNPDAFPCAAIGRFPFALSEHKVRVLLPATANRLSLGVCRPPPVSTEPDAWRRPADVDRADSWSVSVGTFAAFHGTTWKAMDQWCVLPPMALAALRAAATTKVWTVEAVGEVRLTADEQYLGCPFTGIERLSECVLYVGFSEPSLAEVLSD
jgi:hypothetical protein